MLTAEQERFWNYFKWDPARFANSWAELVLESSPKDQPRIIDQGVDQLLDSEKDPRIIANVIHTWLSKHQLPMDASKIRRFARVHELISPLFADFNIKEWIERY